MSLGDKGEVAEVDKEGGILCLRKHQRGQGENFKCGDRCRLTRPGRDGEVEAENKVILIP